METALASVFLSMLILAAVGLTDYLDQLKFVNALVEQKLDDSAIKPLTFESSALVEPRLNVNSLALQTYINTLLDSVRLVLEDRGVPEYLIEAGYAKADLDPVSGAFLGFDDAAYFSRIDGTLQVPATALTFSELRVRFEQLASSRQTEGALRGAAVIAVPQSNSQADPRAQKFLNASVVVGLRVFASLQGTLAGTTCRQLGLDPFVESYKVVQLRGVVE